MWVLAGIVTTTESWLSKLLALSVEPVGSLRTIGLKYKVKAVSLVGCIPISEDAGNKAESPVASSSASVASVLKYKYFSILIY